MNECRVVQISSHRERRLHWRMSSLIAAFHAAQTQAIAAHDEAAQALSKDSAAQSRLSAAARALRTEETRLRALGRGPNNPHPPAA